MEWYTAAEKFNQALSSADPTPGGGAAAAMTATMGCSLALMALQTTLQKKSTPEDKKPKLQNALHKLGALKNQLSHFIEEDGSAYTAFLVAKKLPKENPAREQTIQEALVYAARVPADTATTALTCLKEIDSIKEDIAPIIISDIRCGQYLLKGAIRCCIENIEANLIFIQSDDWIVKFRKQIEIFSKVC